MKYTVTVEIFIGEHRRVTSESFTDQVDALVYANNKVNAIIELGLVDRFTIHTEGERA